jgi:hypothetical protein
MIIALLPLSAMAGETVLDNVYMRVTRDEVSCGSIATVACGSRIIIALGPLEIVTVAARKKLARGDIEVFGSDESYESLLGSYLEIAIKPGHPAATSPIETIAPESNARLYDGDDFFVFEERLGVGDTRARHSHCDRLVVQLNHTHLRQWPDGMPEKIVETVPDRPIFAPAVIHRVTNIGDAPLRGIIVEFKPRK